MGWFEKQIYNRREADDQLLEDSYVRIMGVVMGEKSARRISNEWIITRIGADIKIKCQKCGRSIMLPRIEFNKKLKKVISL